MLRRYIDSIRAERPGNQIPVRARFSAPVQIGPGPYPVSYTMGIGSFTGVQRPGRGVYYPPHLSPKLKSRVIPLLHLWVIVDSSRVNFTFILPLPTRRHILTDVNILIYRLWILMTTLVHPLTSCGRVGPEFLSEFRPRLFDPALLISMHVYFTFTVCWNLIAFTQTFHIVN
jgi:hypothetical protein